MDHFMHIIIKLCPQNMPIDSKLEEEVIRVPVKSPTEPLVKAPADETAV